MASNATSSSPTPSVLISNLGWPATLTSCSLVMSKNLRAALSKRTSNSTCWPYCFSTIFIGTLPGRKPDIFTVFDRRTRRSCFSFSTSALGMARVTLRSSLPRFSITFDMVVDPIQKCSCVRWRYRLRCAICSTAWGRRGTTAHGGLRANGKRGLSHDFGPVPAFLP
ncbi:hypothetical protein D3C72_1704660 [compost metagenome]